MKKFILVLILLFFPVFLRSEKAPSVGYAFSSFALQNLSVMEQEILPILYTYSNVASNNLETLKRYQSSLESVYGSHSKNYTGSDLGSNNPNRNLTKVQIAEELVKNPIQTFRILERFVWDLPLVLKSLDFKLENETLTKLNLLLTNITLPKEGDVRDAQKSIHQLRETYNLSAMDIYSGRLGDYQTYSGLTALNLAEFGMTATEVGLFTLAFEYFDTALLALKPSDPDYENTKDYIFEVMQEVAEAHDRFIKDGSISKHSNPFHYNKTVGDIHSDSFSNKVPVNIKAFLLQHYPPEEVEAQMNFDFVCQKWDSREAVERRSLFCEFSSPHSFYIIQPMKFEWLNLDPPVLQIYEFLNEGEVEILRNEAKGFLLRSEVATSSVKDRIFVGRTSSHQWIADDEPSSRFHFVSQKVSLATGFILDSFDTEMLQVANYGPGGVYRPHYDAYGDGAGSSKKLSPEFIETYLGGLGDRLATLMIYLSDVEAGGGTVFPKLRFTAKPIRRSALFWFNLKIDGTLDPKSLHGGCPVLYGTKYIATKWIRSNSQMFIRKCPISFKHRN